MAEDAMSSPISPRMMSTPTESNDERVKELYLQHTSSTAVATGNEIEAADM